MKNNKFNPIIEYDNRYTISRILLNENYHSWLFWQILNIIVYILYYLYHDNFER